MLGRGIGRLMHMGGTHCSARRRPEIIGKHRLLIGAQRIDRTDMVGNIVVQQYRWALPFIIAEVGAVLRISRERSEEHTSELQSLMRISSAVFCLKKKQKRTIHTLNNTSC